ncbi:hypothetical protein PSAB6_230137 [Paraburkholderia sabiae]|nr:hypothetical protein PSAB6_230137 [Paraburkholderia sabiae]
MASAGGFESDSRKIASKAMFVLRLTYEPAAMPKNASERAAAHGL